MWEMSRHALASMHSSHGVGEYSVTAVWPLAGGLSRRRPHEIIVVVIVVVVVAMVVRRVQVIPSVAAVLVGSVYW